MFILNRLSPFWGLIGLQVLIIKSLSDSKIRLASCEIVGQQHFSEFSANEVIVGSLVAELGRSMLRRYLCSEIS